MSAPQSLLDARPQREWIRPATAMEALERSTPPEGTKWWWRVDEDWRVPPEGAGRCRWMNGRQQCGEKPVASLMRGGYHGPRSVPWDYCAEHLYGRRFEDGRLIVLVARRVAEGE